MNGLVAITREKIAGNAPYIILPDGKELSSVDELLSITMPRRDGGEGRETITVSMSDKVIDMPKGMKFSDVELVYGKADGKVHDLKGVLSVGDADGDEGSLEGQLRAIWYDGDMSLAGTAYEDEMGKDDCGGPYELRITIPRGTKIRAVTRYGYPSGTKERLYHSGSSDEQVIYKFVSGKRRICYLATSVASVSKSMTDLSQIKYAKGYNPAVWGVDERFEHRHYGFKVDSGFPTTGFKGATFVLKGSGYSDQSGYRCSSPNGEGKISLSGNATRDQGLNCHVIYLSVTKGEFIAGGTPIIKMEYNTEEGGWEEVGSFQIPIPKKWAIYKNAEKYVDTISSRRVFRVLDKCLGVPVGTTTEEEALGQSEEARAFRQKYLYRRDELTNSPLVDHILYPEGRGEGGGSKTIYSSRDVDGTFAGEWGYQFFIFGSYNGKAWTAEPFDSKSVYAIGGTKQNSNEYGMINSSSSFGYIYCRGD